MAISTSGQLDENAELGDRVADGAVGTSSTKPARRKAGRERGYHLEIFFICFASLLLEISQHAHRLVQALLLLHVFVIGLALLGIGCGSVATAISPRLKRAKTDTIIMLGCLVVGPPASSWAT